MNRPGTRRTLPLILLAACMFAMPNQVAAQITLTWNGNLSTTWDRATNNWTGGATTFTNGLSDVNFGNSAAQFNVAVQAGGVSPRSIFLNNDAAHTYTFSGGAISGTGGLTKIGDGTIVVTNDLNYSGDTTISVGTLQIGNGTASGSIVGNITNSGTLVFNRSGSHAINGVISGNGGLIQVGTGTTTLAAANTFSGAVSVRDGKLRISHSGALGNAAAIYLGSDNKTGELSFSTPTTVTQNIFLVGTNGVGAITNYGAGPPAVVINGNITNSGPGLRQFSIFGSGGGTVNGLLSNGGGTLGLVTGGPALWSVTNTGNSFTGGVTINVGTLRVPDLQALNFVANNIRFSAVGPVNSAHLATAGTITGGVAPSGAGNFTWEGSGGFSAFGGSLDVLLDGGGTLTWGVDGFVPVGSMLQLNSLQGGNNVVDFQNDVDLAGGNRTIQVRNNNSTTADYAVMSGVVSNGSITKFDEGLLVLTRDNLLSGTSVLLDGAIGFGHDRALGNSVLSVTANSASVPSILAFGAPRTVTNNIQLTGPLDVGGSQNLTLGGVISGSGNVRFVNTGVTMLAGNNNYTGTTAVNAGTLVVNGALGNTALAVNDNAVLKGNGAIQGTVTIQPGGTISPGNSVGMLTLGGLTLNSSNADPATAIFEFSNAVGSMPGADWDYLDVNGTLTINATAADRMTLKIDSWKFDNTAHGGGPGADWNYFDPQQSYSWKWIEADGIVLSGSDSIDSRFLIVDDGFNSGVFGADNPYTRFGSSYFNVSRIGNALYVNYHSAVPEPGSMVLAGLAALGGFVRYRRRNANAAAVESSVVTDVS